MFDEFAEYFRTACRAEGLGIDEAKDHLPFCAEFPVLVHYRLPDYHFCHGDLVEFCRCREDISHPCRMLEMALYGNYRDHHAKFFLTPFDGETQFHHHEVAGILEVTDVIRVVNHPHLVRFVVPNGKTCAENRHNKNVIT